MDAKLSKVQLSITVDVKKCSACGGGHRSLQFYIRFGEGYTHKGLCRKTGEPLFLTVNESEVKVGD